jgi:hypothetical protein
MVLKFDSKIKEHALRLTKKDFKEINKNKVKYNGEKYTYILDIKEKKCTCKNYLKHAICHHLVAYSNLNDLNMFDLKYLDKNSNFVKKIKRGAKSGKYKNAEKAYVKDV